MRGRIVQPMTTPNNKTPILIAIGGLSGTGKSTLARGIAASLPDTVMIDSDVTRKEMFGVPATERLPPECYSREASENLYAEMVRRTEKALADGKNVVVSATFGFYTARTEQENIAKAAGARFQGIWLQAKLDTLFDRVAKRTNDASDATVEILKKQAKYDQGIAFWPGINADQKPEDVLSQALVMLTPPANPAAPRADKNGPAA